MSQLYFVVKISNLKMVAVNTFLANHNNCRLLCHLLVILKVIFANRVHTVCLYMYAKISLKRLQEYGIQQTI